MLPNPLSRRGFSLVEVMVAIGAVIILLAISFPAFKRMQDARDLANCVSRLRQLGVGMTLYAGESGKGEWAYHQALNIKNGTQGSWSGTALWQPEHQQLNGWGKTYPYLENGDTYICPATRLEVRPVQKVRTIIGHKATVWGDYVARGYDQSRLSTTEVKGEALGRRLAQVSSRAVGSCFFLCSPNNAYPHRYPFTLHHRQWPVLYGDGSISVVKGAPPLLPTPGEKQNIWGTTSLQTIFWDHFDTAR